MRHLLAVLPLASLGLVVACGGDDTSARSAASFCDAARTLDTEGFHLLDTASGPAETEAGLNTLLQQLRDVSSAAPAEVKDDVERLESLMGDVAEGLKEADYDLNAYFLSAEGSEPLNAILQSDTTELDAYLEDNCGIVTTDG